MENSKRDDFKEGCYSVNGAGKLGKNKEKNLSASYRTRIYDLPICTRGRSTTNLQETRGKLSRINRPMMTNSLHIAKIEMFRFSLFTS